MVVGPIKSRELSVVARLSAQQSMAVFPFVEGTYGQWGEINCPAIAGPSCCASWPSSTGRPPTCAPPLAAALSTCPNDTCSFPCVRQPRPTLAGRPLAEQARRVKGPYGLPFFRDDAGESRPGVVLMPAGGGDFWNEIAQDLRDASPRAYAKLLATYPDGASGLDLQPFFDLISIHELGHAFEVLGDLRLPTFWLSEIFVKLAMHAFVATQLPASLPTLEVLPTVGAGSRKARRSDARRGVQHPGGPAGAFYGW